MSSTGPEFDPFSRPAKPAGDSPAAPPPNSGYAQQNWPGGPGPWPLAEAPRGLAIASLVCGTSGVMLSWLTFGVPSLLAVIFGHVALSKVKHGTGSGRELAIAGLITGYVMIGIFVVALLSISLAVLSFAAV